jgi:hypothetical protein
LMVNLRHGGQLVIPHRSGGPFGSSASLGGGGGAASLTGIW